MVITVTQVSAEPIRVVESPSNANANIRFGHAIANANVNGNDDSDNVVRLVRPTFVMTTTTEVKGKGKGHHFCGASIKAKALRMSNAFFHALGLPVNEMGDHGSFKGEVPNDAVPITGEVRILPVPFIGGAPITSNIPTNPSQEEHPGANGIRISLPDGHRHHHHHHHHHDMKHKKAGTFLMRVHRAIMALGPWEGRAVAFVLGECFASITKTLLIAWKGCGIGVLLRMFWVMSVLVYRTIRGDRTEEDTIDHGYIMFEHDPENLFVPPPEYTDEKVKVAELEAQEIEVRA